MTVTGDSPWRYAVFKPLIEMSPSHAGGVCGGVGPASVEDEEEEEEKEEENPASGPTKPKSPWDQYSISREHVLKSALYPAVASITPPFSINNMLLPGSNVLIMNGL
jgi:hypothetical protein